MPKQNNDFLKLAKKSGFNLNTGFNSIGIMIDSLGPNQIAYTFISSANKWLKDNFGINVTAFYKEQETPCLPLDFARFNMAQISSFNGHLVATSFNTALSLKDLLGIRRYYYINDITEPNRLKIDEQKKYNEIITDSNIIKFCRCKDYVNDYQNRKFNVSNVIVKDFDFDKILEITNDSNVR